MAEFIVKPDYTMLSKESHGRLYKWNFGTDTEPERIVRCRDCKKYKTGWADRNRSMKCFHDNPNGFCAWGERDD